MFYWNGGSFRPNTEKTSNRKTTARMFYRTPKGNLNQVCCTADPLFFPFNNHLAIVDYRLLEGSMGCAIDSESSACTICGLRKSSVLVVWTAISCRQAGGLAYREWEVGTPKARPLIYNYVWTKVMLRQDLIHACMRIRTLTTTNG